jgi:hypothetical protein
MAPGLALPRLVAVCSVVVADVAVVFVWARGLPAAAPRAGRRATLAAPVVGRGLPAAAARNGVDGCFVVRVDGGDGVAPPPAVELVRVLREHYSQVLMYLSSTVYWPQEIIAK